MSIKVHLRPDWFEAKERLLVDTGALQVFQFRYDSGVAALRLVNDLGEIIVLPYQGQQVWRANFLGRDLTMQTHFDEPVATQTYLQNYGAFFIHCGVTAMGAPGPADTHPLHGELPNAPMQAAHLLVDDEQQSITVVSEYTHTVAFSTHYLATATTVLRAGSGLIDISLQVENRKRTPMDLMYLGHANFRAVDNGALHYTAPYTAEAVRVRQSIPAHITPLPGYAEFLAELAVDPTPHHILKPGLGFDPEVVFFIDFQADAEGWAHAVQRHPDGAGDYARFRPDQAANSVRWICRTPDKNAIAFVSPSTSGVEGYTAEKAAGRVVDVAGGDRWRIDMTMGALSPAETAAQIAAIDRLMGRQG